MVVRQARLDVYDPLPPDGKTVSYRAVGKIVSGGYLCVMYLCSIY